MLSMLADSIYCNVKGLRPQDVFICSLINCDKFFCYNIVILTNILDFQNLSKTIVKVKLYKGLGDLKMQQNYKKI